MPLPSPPHPSLAGFIAWVRQVMAVPVGALPDNAVVLELAYNTSLLTVNPELDVVQERNIVYSEGGVPRYPSIYTLAVYNLGGDFLVNMAYDMPGGVPPTYWADLRKGLGLNNFIAGFIQSSSDQGTSQSTAISESLKNMGLADLLHMRTPWGRTYVAIAQKAGESVWGLTR